MFSANELREEFSRFGEIRDVYVPRDYYTKEPRGFAYIEFAERKDADEALEKMNGFEFDDRRIQVEYAKGSRKTTGEMRDRDLYVYCHIASNWRWRW